MEDDLIEILSDIEHARWSKWMIYMFSCGKHNEDGTWTMPADKVERWYYQMNTDYKNLSEKTKDSDRAEAMVTVKAIANWMAMKCRGKNDE